jgi:anti-sigma regulatory factor (Ser/Thr protein kinase)
MLLYAGGPDGFVAVTLPAIREALSAQEPVLVVAAGERIGPLKEALGEDAARVGFADVRELGANPARIIPAFREFLATNSSNGDRALGIGETIWPGRSEEEIAECHRHEELLDLAFADGPAWHLLCAYDSEALGDDVIECARRDHAVHEPPRPFAGTLPPAPADAQELGFAGDELSGLRRFLSSWATAELLDEECAEELVLAVNELATNSIRYGGGHGELRAWRESDVLLVEVRDDGHISDPLVGRTRPRPDASSGRGLWLVNQLCDLVQIRSSPQGSVVRIHKAPLQAQRA